MNPPSDEICDAMIALAERAALPIDLFPLSEFDAVELERFTAALDHLRELVETCDYNSYRDTHCRHGRLPCPHRAAAAWLAAQAPS